MSTSGRSGVRRLGRIGIVAAALLGAVSLTLPAQAAPTTPASAPTHGDRAAAVQMHGTPSTTPLPKPGKRKSAFGARGAVKPAANGTRAEGTPVPSYDYPFIVAVLTRWIGGYNSSGPVYYEGVCTGVITSTTTVLAPAACTTGGPGGEIVVVAGSSDLNDTSSGFVDGVQSTWTDPQFNSAALNFGSTNVPTGDDSILHLTTPLPGLYSSVVIGAHAPTLDSPATMVGYGFDETNGNLLQTQAVQYLDPGNCAALNHFNSSTMTCVADSPATTSVPDVCDGAAGSAMLSNGNVEALANWGSNDCAASAPYIVAEDTAPFSAQVTGQANAPGVNNLDISGDGHADLMMRDGSGTLTEYNGSGFANDGFGGFAGQFRVGPGWNGFSKVLRVQNWWYGDDAVLGVTPGGDLYEYDADENGQLEPNGVLIGTGWNEFTTIIPVPNWHDSYNEPALLGVLPNGDLRVYQNDGEGDWLLGEGVQVGSGWNGFNAIVPVSGFGKSSGPQLLGRTPNGDLRLYTSDGDGGWTNPSGTQIGSGWNAFSGIVAPGDWDGDNLTDLIGVLPDGDMRLYPGNGNAGWLNPSGVKIGQGWQGTTIF